MAELPNLYSKIIEAVFLAHYKSGTTEFVFSREEILENAKELDLEPPKNVGDLIYTFRYRQPLPASIRRRAPKGTEWMIFPAGTAKYCFKATRAQISITPNSMLKLIKVPDATPGIIQKYALSDEQSLLAKLRYNRLIDIFTRITCYSLQSHLRAAVKELGQIEIDELYLGIDRSGTNYILPVQAKGGAGQTQHRANQAGHRPLPRQVSRPRLPPHCGTVHERRHDRSFRI